MELLDSGPDSLGLFHIQEVFENGTSFLDDSFGWHNPRVVFQDGEPVESVQQSHCILRLAKTWNGITDRMGV